MSEPLVVMTASEVKRLMFEAVAEAMGGYNPADEKPVTIKGFADLVPFGKDRVRSWCVDGCPVCGTKLPHIKSSERGTYIYPSKGRAWMEEHVGAEGCHG